MTPSPERANLVTSSLVQEIYHLMGIGTYPIEAGGEMCLERTGMCALEGSGGKPVDADDPFVCRESRSFDRNANFVRLG